MKNQTIEHLIAMINERINRQVNCILHHPDFQRLESVWRGLFMLIQTAGMSKYVVIRFLDISYRELSKDMDQAIEFDQSQLFKKVYSNEFDQPGGQPFGVLIGDYHFSHRSKMRMQNGVDLLRKIAEVCAAAFVPFVAGVDPSLFGLDSFTEFQMPFQLNDIFQQTEYQRWKNLREDEDIRYVALVLPRILMRVPYNNNGIKMTNRFFEENVTKHTDYLWGNASYAYGCVAIQSFIESGWFADIRGYNPSVGQGGSVKLERDYFYTDKAGVMPKMSVEYAITDKQEKIFHDSGFIALRDHRWIEKSVFYSSQSLHHPKRYSTTIGQANAKISSMLHYIFCVSRFAHYIKIIMRDKVGKFINPEECERYLLLWIRKYCAASQGMSEEARARYPLSDADVKVNEQRGAPGKYSCTIHLKPHYQLDDIQSYLKLVTNVKVA